MTLSEGVTREIAKIAAAQNLRSQGIENKRELRRRRRMEAFEIECPVLSFLIRNGNAITSLRSYAQRKDNGSLTDSDQKSFEKAIKERSSGELDLVSGSLCIVGEVNDVNQHNTEGLSKEQLENSIKGFKLVFFVGNKEERKRVTCFIHDHGKSSSYFDNKSDLEKAEFVAKFARRNRVISHDGETEPLEVAVFVREDPVTRAFAIEQLVYASQAPNAPL